MKTIELRISETSRSNTGYVASTFNIIKESFEDKKQLIEFLVDRYGKMPGGRKKIYRGYEPKEVGFIHSFWNSDISHNSKKWFQTDWIEFFEQETTKTYFKI